MSIIVKRFAAVAVAAIVGMGAIAPSLAGEADVKYRQNVMKAIGGHTGAIGAVVKGEVNDDAGAMHHAIALAESALAAGTAFGPDSKGGAALPAIWEKTDEFKAAYTPLSRPPAK